MTMEIGVVFAILGTSILSLARGKTLRESVLFSVAAGAAAVMTPGTELCRREDAERLYEVMLSDF